MPAPDFAVQIAIHEVPPGVAGGQPGWAVTYPALNPEWRSRFKVGTVVEIDMGHYPQYITVMRECAKGDLEGFITNMVIPGNGL